MSPSSGAADDLAHALIPLALAVGVVRSEVYAGRVASQSPQGDFDMLAGFIAATVPLYEYPADPSAPPRALSRQEVEGGLFRDRARELRFIDGRAAKRNLAVNATDVPGVVSLLKNPERSVRIRSRFVRRWARETRARSAQLVREAAELRGEARRCSSRAAALTSAQDKGRAMQPDPSAGGRRATGGWALGAGPSPAG